MAAIIKGLYDWLLRTFWYACLIFPGFSHAFDEVEQQRAQISHASVPHDVGEILIMLAATGQPRWT